MLKKYKFAHLFVADDIKFNPRVLKMLANKENGFELKDHLFVTSFERVYGVFEEIKRENPELNIEFYKANNLSNISTDISIIEHYAPCCDWIFLHAIFPVYKTIFIKKKYCKKIIWRSWGTNVGVSFYGDNPLKNIVLRIIDWFWQQKIKQFHAIGIANIVDEINIRDKVGSIKTFYMPYSLQGGKDTVEIVRRINKVPSKYLNIMIGHSGHYEDQHIQIMEELAHLKKRPIYLYIILSYGNEIYIREVEKYVETNWKGKATIIKEFLSYKEYVMLLNKMDVAILDGKFSYALGNISILIDLKKKIFLNREGILKRAFEKENIPFCCTDELKCITYEELGEPLDYSQCGQTSLHLKSYDEGIKEWKYMLENLEKNV